MATAGLTPRTIDIRSDGSQLGYLATKTIFAKYRDLTAILAGSDQVAAGVYDALREMNIDIPGRISVVGFNDTQGSVLYPPLTSVREFPEELGRHMAEFALQRLQNPDLATQELTIPTQLILRSSVAAPPAPAAD
jgi:DNA-binding LacI/PurR family transcriptional regulator